MTTSAPSETPFSPVSYETFLENHQDDRGFLALFQKLILERQYGQGAYEIRLSIDPYLSVCMVDSNKRQSVVHKAAEAVNEVALMAFTTTGHICDVQDADCNTPLMILLKKYNNVAENREEKIRTVISAMIKQGVRLNIPNREGQTALFLIFTSVHEDLFLDHMDLPWADFIIEYFSRVYQPSELVQRRLNDLFLRPGFRGNLINRLLKADFSQNAAGLSKLLELSVKDTVYNAPWLGFIRDDQNEDSALQKLTILKNSGFLETMRKNYKGLGFVGKYPRLDQWFQQNMPVLTSALSAPAMAIAPTKSAPQSPRLLSSAPTLRHAATQMQLLATASTSTRPIPTNPRLTNSASMAPPLPPDSASSAYASTSTSAYASTSTRGASSSSPSSPTPPVRNQSRKFSVAAGSPSLPIPVRPKRDDSTMPDMPARESSWSYSAAFNVRTQRKRGNTGDEHTATLPVAGNKAEDDAKTVNEHAQPLGEVSTLKRMDSRKELSVRSNILKYVGSEDKKEQTYAKEWLLLNPEAVNQAFEGKTYLIFRAIAAGRVGMSKFLLDKDADVNVADDSKDTPLHAAVQNKSVDPKRMGKIIGYILEKKPNLEFKNQRQETSLDLAFDSEEPEILKPFLPFMGSLEQRIRERINDKFQKNEGTKDCVVLAIKSGNVPLKAVLCMLFCRELLEADVHMRKLLEEVLELCEVMEEEDMEVLSSDANKESSKNKLSEIEKKNIKESFDFKLSCLKKYPKLYKQILNLVLKSSDSSTNLLKSMIMKKDPKMIIDYNLIFDDENKKSRAAKIQILMDLDLIPKTKKASVIAETTKPLDLVDAFDYGFTCLFPPLNEGKWPAMLQAFSQGRRTLSELQIVFLNRRMPQDPIRVKDVVAMLFRQDFHARLDPIIKGPLEMMLEIVIPHCTGIQDSWHELVLYLKNDPSQVSRDRKMAICKQNVEFYYFLDMSLKGKLDQKIPSPGSSPPKGMVAIVLERESYSSSASSSSSSSRTSKKSPPGSGPTSPRGSGKK